MEPFLLGLVLLEAVLREDQGQFKWRTETYEFVDEPIAIDLLCGSAEARVGLESRMRPRELIEGWQTQQNDWLERRELYLLY
jgi:hypothetical protein